MKFWIVLSSVLLVAAGFAAGFFVSRDCGLGGDSPPSERRGNFPFLWPEGLQSFFTSDDVYRELKLDAPQRQVIEWLLSSHSQSVKELRDNMSELGTKLRDGINAALTEAQRKRFEEVQKEWAERELEGHAAREAADLRRELGLNEEITAQVQSILLDVARERREAGVSGRGRSEDWKAIRTKRDARIEKVLSAEQFEGYRKLKDRRRMFQPEKGPPGPGSPGGRPRVEGPPGN